jgi:hypothetical protein
LLYPGPLKYLNKSNERLSLHSYRQPSPLSKVPTYCPHLPIMSWRLHLWTWTLG